MLFKVLPIVCGLACLATAQAADFTGPYVRGTLDLVAAQTRLRQYNPDTTVSAHAASPRLALGYTWQTGGLYLGFNGFAQLGSVRAGAIEGEDFLGRWRDDFRLSQIRGLALEPGFRVNNTLVTASLAWVQARGRNSYSYDGGSDTGAAQARHSGTGLGVGFRHALTPQLELTGELQHLRFKRRLYYTDVPETYQPSATLAGLGLAYRF